MTAVHMTWDLPQATDPLLEWMHGRLFAAKGVESVVRTSPTTLEVRSANWPTWAVVLSIVLFPIGLLFLLCKQRHTMLIQATPASPGARVTFQGAASPNAIVSLMRLRPTLELVAA